MTKRLLSTALVAWLPIIIALLLLGVLILIHVQLHEYAFDDAFIHFRIARNFIESGAPYYNANEALKVSTSSGWTIVLTLLLGIARVLKIDDSFPLLVSIANAIIAFGALLVYTRVTEALLKRQMSLTEKLLFQIPFLALLVPSSIGLMETPLALLLAGLGLYLLLLSKPVGFGLIAASVYVRLELAVLLLLVTFVLVFRRKLESGHIIVLGIGVIPFLLYDLYFFRTIIPHSIVAKSTVYSMTVLQSAIYVLFYSVPMVPFRYGLAANGMLFLSFLVITVKSAIADSQGDSRAWHMLLCCWGICTIAGYIVGHAYVFDWYRALYTIPLFVSSFLFMRNRRNVGVRVNHYLLLVVCSAYLITTVYASVNDPSYFSHFVGGSRVKLYLDIGKKLNSEYPGARLLTSEIGGLGYTFTGEILDAAGLASPEALEFHPLRVPEERAGGDIGAIPPKYVRAQMPELIVSYDHFTHALLMDDIIQQYHVIPIPAYLPEDAVYSDSKTIWDSTYLRIYIRKDLPLPKKALTAGE